MKTLLPMLASVWPLTSEDQTPVGGLAQLGEHLLCKQGVIGSIPIVSRRKSSAISHRSSEERGSSFVARLAFLDD